MARRFSLTLALAAIAATTFSQGFGRFGYVKEPTLPGISIDREGFVAKHPRADKLRFGAALKEWTPVSITPEDMVVQVGGKVAYQPQKLRFHLTSPGLSMYCPMGVRLRSSATSAPYLTWSEGSVTQGVPTPSASWVMVSFRDDQPPLILGFPDAKAAVEIRGTPGSWTIQTPLEYAGWVRVGLPLGTTGHPANSAAALGRLAAVAKEQELIWSHRAPAQSELSLESDLLSVTATWRFSEPGAVVPNAAVFAALGGYPVKIYSRTERTQILTEEGPTEIVLDDELRIRFPIRRVPLGRGLAIGTLVSTPLGTASPLDIPSVTELALESLTGSRDRLTADSAEETLAEYLVQALYLEEPNTKQQLPFDPTGKGIDLASAHALLMQAIASMSTPKNEPNALLTSVDWRRDWLSWLPAKVEGDVARRSAALCAIAASLCPESERRLVGAMFQAGLAGERGLNIWRRRSGAIASEPPLLEPMFGLRQGLFGLAGPSDPAAAFTSTLLSPIRIFSTGPARLEQRDKELVLTWPALEPKPSVATLAAAFPLQIDATANLTKLEVSQALGLFELLYVPTAAGQCEAKITIPPWAKSPPPSAATPRYSEPKR